MWCVTSKYQHITSVQYSMFCLWHLCAFYKPQLVTESFIPLLSVFICPEYTTIPNIHEVKENMTMGTTLVADPDGNGFLVRRQSVLHDSNSFPQSVPQTSVMWTVDRLAKVYGWVFVGFYWSISHIFHRESRRVSAVLQLEFELLTNFWKNSFMNERLTHFSLRL